MECKARAGSPATRGGVGRVDRAFRLACCVAVLTACGGDGDREAITSPPSTPAPLPPPTPIHGPPSRILAFGFAESGVVAGATIPGAGVLVIDTEHRGVPDISVDVEVLAGNPVLDSLHMRTDHNGIARFGALKLPTSEGTVKLRLSAGGVILKTITLECVRPLAVTRATFELRLVDGEPLPLPVHQMNGSRSDLLEWARLSLDDQTYTLRLGIKLPNGQLMEAQEFGTIRPVAPMHPQRTLELRPDAQAPGNYFDRNPALTTQDGRLFVLHWSDDGWAIPGETSVFQRVAQEQQ